jgi:putative CocE/NonD family hydrolase
MNRFAPLAALCTSLLLAACESAVPTGLEEEPVLTLPEGGQHLDHLQVRMRDGVRLDTDVWLPGDGSFPAVLVRTPYRDEVNRSAFLQRALESGYAVIQQHERGRFWSEGDMRMLGNADEDGWDTLDWIAAQPWSNGKVATYGCSSSAENQLKLGTLGHPAHKAMIAFSSGVGIAEAGPFREQGNFWRGGAWQMGWADYFFGEMALNWPQLPAGLSDEERRRLSRMHALETDQAIPHDVYDAARLHLPMIELASAAGAPDTEIEEYLLRGPSHPDWAADRITNAETIKVPTLFAEGLYDISARSAAALFERTRAALPRDAAAIILTNGPHCGFGRETETSIIGDRPLGDARFDYLSRQMAWLDRWLKEDANAPTPLPVTAYMAGANLWTSFEGIPAAGTAPTRVLHLASGGRANTFGGDGVLAEAAPLSAGADTFRYDPANPVIARGGEIAGLGTDQDDGAFDQREIESREDVLVYTSAPLERDLAVFGFVDMQLSVSSDAPDTDFTVKLVDVAPDGAAWNIADSIQRMRYREGEDREVFMASGEVYRIAPPPMLVANVFRAGHHIRLEVSSSNFPAYARNLNTRENPYTSTAMQVAVNTVRHGPGETSFIRLPVVELPTP